MDKLTFMKQWWDAILKDDALDMTPQDMACILYAAACYAFNGEKIKIGEVFGNEYRGLNMAMPNIYSQMDNIKEYGEKNKIKNQKYDNEAIKELAAQGLTQREICLELGYDVSKCKSLSSNQGYKDGRDIFRQEKLENDRNSTERVRNLKDVKEIAKTSENSIEIAKTGGSSVNPFNF